MDTLVFNVSERNEKGKKARMNGQIPCIIYGHGVQQDWLPSNATGCAMQILPTLAEIAGQPNMQYSSILPSLFANDKPVFNHRFYAWDDKIYDLNAKAPDIIKDRSDAAKKITAWRIIRGSKID